MGKIKTAIKINIKIYCELIYNNCKLGFEAKFYNFFTAKALKTRNV